MCEILAIEGDCRSGIQTCDKSERLHPQAAQSPIQFIAIATMHQNEMEHE